VAKRPSKPAGTAKSKASKQADDAPAPRASREPIAPPQPKRFAEILGHARALDILRSALRSERIHHAWLFQGPTGVGKFTTALAFAAILLDPTSQATFSGDIEPDPDSPTQTLLRAGSHPDLHIVVKELARFSEEKTVRDRKLTQIPKEVIDEHVIRAAALSSALRTSALASKVFIIDEAEMLNNASQNALLKTLEEPPPGTVLILVTSSEEQLLPTIRSRSQRIAFAPLSDAEMSTWVKQHANVPDPAQLAWLTEFAEGSPGAFVRARDGGLSAWRERLAPYIDAALHGKHPIELGPAMAELCEQWAKDYVDAKQNASKEAANHEAADWMFRLISGELRRGLRAAAANPAASARYASAIELIRDAEAQIGSNVSALFAMDRFAGELSATFAGAR
jgi:DNA polymerase-3 subunit delta'